MEGSTAVPSPDAASAGFTRLLAQACERRHPAGPLVDAGDPVQTLAQLYDDHHAAVWNFARFWLRTPEDAEDAVQDTFLRAHRALARGRPPQAPRAWLMTVCRNVCHDRRRSRHRRDTMPLECVAAAVFAVDEDHDRQLDVRDVLSALAPQEQEAFFLVDVLGLHSDEAAAVLGLRASSTLRSRLGRARAAVAPVLRDLPAPPRMAVTPAEVWGLLHAPPARAVVLTTVGAPLRRLAARVRIPSFAPGDGPPVVTFLDALDRQLPGHLPLVAVIDEQRREAQAERWVAEHPRWELRPLGHDEAWLSTVHALLQNDRERSLDHLRMRALLDDATPFVWTYT